MTAEAIAAERPPVRIGILAFRDLVTTAQMWEPTVRHLEQAVPGRRFELLPLHNQELEQAVADGRVDFVLTQPEQYVILRTRHGLAAMATLMPLAAGRPVSEFGGVIFTRRGRSDITRLADIRGKRVAAVYEHSLGAFRAQQWTLLQAGVSLPDNVGSLIFTGQPQDKVVEAVLSGKADVGFVRTGLLESLTQEGKIDPAQLRVVNPQAADDFPLQHSTDLYPEWPFAAARGVPDALVKAVALALLNIPPESPAAQAGQYYGFAPPGDYAPLDALLARLKVHPGRNTDFDIRDIARKYSSALAAIGILLLMLAASVGYRLHRDNQQIKKASRDQELLLGSLGEGVCGFDRMGRCSFVNPAGAAMAGFDPADMVGYQGDAWFRFAEDARRPPQGDVRPLAQTLADGSRREGEARLCRKDGGCLPIHYAMAPIRERQQVVGVVVVFQDITERKQAEADLRIAAVAFEAQEGMIITDPDARILRVNHAFTNLTGYRSDEVLGRTPALLQSGRHERAFYQTMWDTLARDGQWQGEIWNRRKNGDIFPEWLTITAVKRLDGSVGHYVGSFLDIGERKQAEEKIEYMALYDLLTGLPNRRLLIERLERALISRSRADRHGALIFIDLDNFKTLNDTRGHDMGDRLLQQVAQRLATCVREDDTVARLGGDEFVVMLEDLESRPEEAAAQAEMVGEKILATLNRPYRLGDTDHHGGASLGLVVFHNHDLGVDELLKRADMAMYQSKAVGRNTLRFFDPAMQIAVEERAALEKEFRLGLERREFLLHYQPQVDPSGRVFGAEALVRWAHPERGLTPPAVFIPLAETSGLILPLGQQVLEMACRQLAAWQNEPRTAHLTLSVNVSARQFRQADFVDRVVRVLAQTGAKGQGLKLELTESLMLDGVDSVIEKMTTLKALGLGFSLDDFGTGYSSLAYLKRLPLDQIKIDQSFVRDALHDGNDAAITRTLLALGRTFGLSVVAEGVETEAQKDFLLGHGCDAFQGFLFSHPKEAHELDLGHGED